MNFSRLTTAWLALGVALICASTLFAQRRMENLTRGIVAAPTDEGVFVSWRMFATDPEEIAFNLYRQASNGDAVRVNEEPIRERTNYLDESSSRDVTLQQRESEKRESQQGDIQYFLCPVIDGQELAPTTPASIWEAGYLEIPIQPIDGYRPGDASVADLDGDGEYEIVLHQVSRPRDNSHAGLTGTPILDAYELDGTHLWRIDLGLNIREGEHYTQFMVYDLDGDGRAEVACKTADGTVDGVGGVIGDATKGLSRAG